MSALETVVVAAVVLAAAAYLGRRVLRSASGGACGCGADPRKGCPAAGSVAADLERLARTSAGQGARGADRSSP